MALHHRATEVGLAKREGERSWRCLLGLLNGSGPKSDFEVGGESKADDSVAYRTKLEGWKIRGMEDGGITVCSCKPMRDMAIQ